MLRSFDLNRRITVYVGCSSDENIFLTSCDLLRGVPVIEKTVKGWLLGPKDSVLGVKVNELRIMKSRVC